MTNLEIDFKNYILQHTAPCHQNAMKTLLDHKKWLETNSRLTPADVIDFMTHFYSLVEADFRPNVDAVLDPDGHIIESSHYLFSNQISATSSVAS